jgi:hypothetical protein
MLNHTHTHTHTHIYMVLEECQVRGEDQPPFHDKRKLLLNFMVDLSMGNYKFP